MEFETKMTVYKQVFIPMLIYGAESWLSIKTFKSCIQAIEK